MNFENQSSEDAEKTSSPNRLNRRSFLHLAGTGLAAAAVVRAAGAGDAAEAAAANKVSLPPLDLEGPEQAQPLPKPPLPLNERVGFAIVGLGHLSLGQILPAFGESKYAKPVALVSGDREKARRIAKQYNIREEAIYDYTTYDALKNNPEVQVIYIVLPNSMHADFTVRGARAGKHILCEKPMATSVADCERMIAACETAKVKLMIAYRSQYEPFDRAIVKAVREKKLGELREFVSANSQNQGDPKQWRLNQKLAGGGPVPDVGIYCINAARFISGEEPSEVFGQVVRKPEDPRFVEVEASAQFILKFPSGLTAACSCSYDSHRSQFFRLQGSEGWAELNPAFAYTGLKARFRHKVSLHDTTLEPAIEAKNQFALEMDHFAECVTADRKPHTPGEEGLQDQRIVEAIYESARTGKKVSLAPVASPRGPELMEPKAD